MARIWYRPMIAGLRIVTARAAQVPAGRKMSLAGNTINRMEVTMTDTGPRSEVDYLTPFRPGHGSSRMWSRTIGGRRYSFTAVLMPDGERRYFARQLEAGRDDQAALFACYWHPVLAWILPAGRNVTGR